MGFFKTLNRNKPSIIRFIYQYPDGHLPEHNFSAKQLRTIKRLLKKQDGYAVVHFTASGPKLLEPSEVAIITAMDEG